MGSIFLTAHISHSLVMLLSFVPAFILPRQFPLNVIALRFGSRSVSELQKTEDVELARGSIPLFNRRRLYNLEMRRQGIDPKAKEINADGVVNPFPPSMRRGTPFLDQLIESQSKCINTVAPLIIQPDASWLAVPADSEPQRYKYCITDTDINSVVSEEHRDTVKRILALDMGTQEDINKYNKKIIQSVFGHHPLDCGSTEVQIGIFSLQILILARHCKEKRKDHPAKSYLIQYIQRRKRALKYLRKLSLERYFAIMEKLSIVHTDLV